MHKTTAFTGEELAGVSDALAAVKEIECIEITKRVAWRGVWLRASGRAEGKSEPDKYPVHRGTVVPLSGTTALVWVAGNAPSVARRGDSYFQGGKSIPAPVLLTRHMGRGPLELIASEALSLTKMDWNNDALYDPSRHDGYSQRLARTIANVPTLPRRFYPYRMFRRGADPTRSRHGDGGAAGCPVFSAYIPVRLGSTNWSADLKSCGRSSAMVGADLAVKRS